MTAEVFSPPPAGELPFNWLDGLEDGCLLVDGDLTVLYANASYTDSLGQTPGDAFGRPLSKLTEGGADSVACRIARAAVETGRSHDADERIGDRCYHLRARVVPAGVVIQRTDVTDRHEAAEERAGLQEQLFLAQKRESLGVLAAGVAHDFNNMLSAIVSSVGLILRDLPPAGAPYESAILIKKAAERAAEVTRQMLVYAGKSMPARRPVDLSELIRDSLTLLSAAFPRRATLDVHLAERLPAVNADPGQMQQVVMNLLLNAGEATAPSGGTVTLTTGSYSDNGATVVYLEVADTGCGMTPEVRSRVFDPFYTTKGRGRGLGLSAVQGIVQAHGGQLHLTSEAGRGTTFRVELPVQEAPAVSCR
jgi:signal transduction histidine kinase